MPKFIFNTLRDDNTWGLEEKPVSVYIDDEILIQVSADQVIVEYDPKAYDTTAMGDISTKHILVNDEPIERKIVRAIDALNYILDKKSEMSVREEGDMFR